MAHSCTSWWHLITTQITTWPVHNQLWLDADNIWWPIIVSIGESATRHPSRGRHLPLHQSQPRHAFRTREVLVGFYDVQRSLVTLRGCPALLSSVGSDRQRIPGPLLWIKVRDDCDGWFPGLWGVMMPGSGKAINLHIEFHYSLRTVFIITIKNYQERTYSLFLHHSYNQPFCVHQLLIGGQWWNFSHILMTLAMMKPASIECQSLWTTCCWLWRLLVGYQLLPTHATLSILDACRSHDSGLFAAIIGLKNSQTFSIICNCVNPIAKHAD